MQALGDLRHDGRPLQQRLHLPLIPQQRRLGAALAPTLDPVQLLRGSQSAFLYIPFMRLTIIVRLMVGNAWIQESAVSMQSQGAVIM